MQNLLKMCVLQGLMLGGYQFWQIAWGGGGVWQVRNSERRNVAQQNCTTFCCGI